MNYEKKIKFAKNYFFIGITNTLFGYFFGVYILFLFKTSIGILACSIVSHLTSVTFSFFTLFFFVFKQQSLFIKKLIKFHSSYLILSIFNYLILKLSIDFFQINFFISQGFVILFSIIFGLIINIKYNFR